MILFIFSHWKHADYISTSFLLQNITITWRDAVKKSNLHLKLIYLTLRWQLFTIYEVPRRLQK